LFHEFLQMLIHGLGASVRMFVASARRDEIPALVLDAVLKPRVSSGLRVPADYSATISAIPRPF
jgi:hypothetical protein